MNLCLGCFRRGKRKRVREFDWAYLGVRDGLKSGQDLRVRCRAVASEKPGHGGEKGKDMCGQVRYA